MTQLELFPEGKPDVPQPAEAFGDTLVMRAAMQIASAAFFALVVRPRPQGGDFLRARGCAASYTLAKCWKSNRV